MKFKFELSDFTFVDRAKQTGRMLRFTLTWVLEHPDYGRLSHAMSGCLFRKNSKGETNWSPPLNKIGPFAAKQLNLISPDYYNLVLNTLVNTDYVNHIGTPPEMTSLQAQDVDPALPKTLGDRNDATA